MVDTIVCPIYVWDGVSETMEREREKNHTR